MAGTALERPARGKIVAGVCAGIADQFGWSRTLVRLAFVVSCVLPGRRSSSTRSAGS